MIRTTDMVKVFRTDEVETHALSGVSLSIKEGEFEQGGFTTSRWPHYGHILVLVNSKRHPFERLNYNCSNLVVLLDIVYRN